MNCSQWRTLFVAASLLLATNALANGKAISIEGITVQLFSHEDGTLRALDDPPNPYGMNMDLFILVKVTGQAKYTDRPRKLELTLSAPAWSDGATGSHPPWQWTKQAAFHFLPEGRQRYLLFVAPYEDCYPKVTLSAVIHGDESVIDKTRQISLACAE